MAGFLRRKTQTDVKSNKNATSRPTQQSSPAANSVTSSTSTVPPLYARFASSQSAATSSETSSEGNRRLVSGPMPLSNARKADPRQRPPASGYGTRLSSSGRRRSDSRGSRQGEINSFRSETTFSTPSRRVSASGTHLKGLSDTSISAQIPRNSVLSQLSKTSSKSVAVDKPLPSPDAQPIASDPRPTSPHGSRRTSTRVASIVSSQRQSHDYSIRGSIRPPSLDDKPLPQPVPSVAPQRTLRRTKSPTEAPDGRQSGARGSSVSTSQPAASHSGSLAVIDPATPNNVSAEKIRPTQLLVQPQASHVPSRDSAVVGVQLRERDLPAPPPATPPTSVLSPPPSPSLVPSFSYNEPPNLQPPQRDFGPRPSNPPTNTSFPQSAQVHVANYAAPRGMPHGTTASFSAQEMPSSGGVAVPAPEMHPLRNKEPSAVVTSPPSSSVPKRSASKPHASSIPSQQSSNAPFVEHARRNKADIPASSYRPPLDGQPIQNYPSAAPFAVQTLHSSTPPITAPAAQSVYRTTDRDVLQPAFTQEPRRMQSSRGAPQRRPSATAPVQGRPRIFAAMAEAEQFDEPGASSQFGSDTVPPSHESEYTYNPVPTPQSYPSPPMENTTLARVHAHPSASQDMDVPLNGSSNMIDAVPPERHEHMGSPPTVMDAYMTRHWQDQSFVQPQVQPRSRKTSKSSTAAPVVYAPPIVHSESTGYSSTPEPPEKRPSTRVLTKPRPTTPVSPGKQHRKISPPIEPEVDRGESLIDDDPFAKAEVQMVKTPSREGLLSKQPSREGLASKPPSREGLPSKPPSRDGLSSRPASRDGTSSKLSSRDGVPSKPPSRDGTVSVKKPRSRDGPMTDAASISKRSKNSHGSDAEINVQSVPPQRPPSPVSPDEYRRARSRRRGTKLEKAPPPLVADVIAQQLAPKEPTFFPIISYVSKPSLLSLLLGYLSFYEWCVLFSVSKAIRTMIEGKRELREEVLERYLCMVGYARWEWETKEPLPISLKDLNDYMRGVSIPTHQYNHQAESFLQTISLHPQDPQAQAQAETTRALRASTRAYTRVVLHLRAQAETEQAHAPPPPPPHFEPSRGPPSVVRNGGGYHSRSQSRGPGTASRASSRAPSPTFSSSHGHAGSHGYYVSPHSMAPPPNSAPVPAGFRSPLFRLRRAPLLRVFVPSPEGDWLSDASVVECEAELRRAGVMRMLRAGDVVWDIAAGDEGNAGRLVWDGSYLIDLDYTWSATGDVPKYLRALTFPPSYFHRVVRTGSLGGPKGNTDNGGNPVVHIDVSPWGEEIAGNLQLLQDRVRTETPQGGRHNVVRWVHRSSFFIRHYYPPGQNIPTDIDAGWHGTIVVEAEGTNEGLADLRARCGAGGVVAFGRGFTGSGKGVQAKNDKEREGRMVWRILRERSRPGEIWIRAVREKERLM